MSTMNISLPEELEVFVDQQVAGRGFSSASECVRESLRRACRVEHLRGWLLEGLESGLAESLSAEWAAAQRTHRAQAAARAPATAQASASSPFLRSIGSSAGARPRNAA